jgi:hypothetical protein
MLLCHQHIFVSAYKIIFHPCYKSVHAIRLKDVTCYSTEQNELQNLADHITSTILMLNTKNRVNNSVT